MVLSKKGFTHYYRGDNTLTPIDDWMRERKAYHLIAQKGFFKDYLAQKTFVLWKKKTLVGVMLQHSAAL